MQLLEPDATRFCVPPSILVVDDSRSYRRLLVALLQQWHYCVAEADNGKQALAMLAAGSFNIVITDWEMPELDGVALCREIRQQKWSHYLYLILLTAHSTNADLITGLEAGADDFLAKPLHQSELRARLHAAERVLSLEAELAARSRTLLRAYQKMEEDLQAAARLQRTILPSGPLREGEFYADFFFLPSDYLSGDIFNLFRLGSQHIGFYSIDVAGHGVSAAMLSLSVARQFLHGRIADQLLLAEISAEPGYHITPPHQVVLELNRRFCKADSHTDSYFTLVYGIIDIPSGEGVLCQAGHPTPFLISNQGQVTEIGAGGAPVGLLEQAEYQDTPFTLQVGDQLYLYTDGIIECENPQHQFFTLQRLQQQLMTWRHLPAVQRFAHIKQALLTWRYGRKPIESRTIHHTSFSDDISLMIIERQH